MKIAKLTAEQIVEMLARMSDAEKQKTANLMVNKWFHLTKNFVSMVDAEMQDQFMEEMAEVHAMKTAAENGTKIW